MSEADALFIAGDTETTYNHTAGLMVLDPPGNKKFDFRYFKRYISKRIAEIPQFHWRLHEVPGGLDRPYWVDSSDFDPANHIRRIAVASPGDAAAVSEIASLIFSRHLDRREPGRAPTGREEYLRTTLHLLRLPGKTIRNLLELVGPAICKQFSPRRKQARAPELALHPRLNADIGPERGYVYLSPSPWVLSTRIPSGA